MEGSGLALPSARRWWRRTAARCRSRANWERGRPFRSHFPGFPEKIWKTNEIQIEDFYNRVVQGASRSGGAADSCRRWGLAVPDKVDRADLAAAASAAPVAVREVPVDPAVADLAEPEPAAVRAAVADKVDRAARAAAKDFLPLPAD